jgi:hypothetical protein
LENELAPYYEEALRIGGARTPNYLTALLGSRKLKIGMDDKLTPLQLPSIFEKRMLPKKDPYFVGMGPERTGCHQHILEALRWGKIP